MTLVELLKLVNVHLPETDDKVRFMRVLADDPKWCKAMSAAADRFEEENAEIIDEIIANTLGVAPPNVTKH